MPGVNINFLGVCTIFRNLPSLVPPGVTVPPNRVVLVKNTLFTQQLSGIDPHIAKIQFVADFTFNGPPLPPVTPGLEGFHTPIVVASIVIAFAGLAVAALLFGRDMRRREAIHTRFALLHRLLSGKYYIDEIYGALIGRPLYWISDHVFLRLGDRALIDGSLHSIAALGRSSAAALGRVQTGQLQFYALLVLIGLVAALAWSWHV
jgi:NADH:ubiquinone oxidoreductase subunit 5 (subunit L)/multisubunit Na+/H+ antiporter MnhA subunit